MRTYVTKHKKYEYSVYSINYPEAWDRYIQGASDYFKLLNELLLASAALIWIFPDSVLQGYADLEKLGFFVFFSLLTVLVEICDLCFINSKTSGSFSCS